MNLGSLLAGLRSLGTRKMAAENAHVVHPVSMEFHPDGYDIQEHLALLKEMELRGEFEPKPEEPVTPVPSEQVLTDALRALELIAAVDRAGLEKAFR